MTTRPVMHSLVCGGGLHCPLKQIGIVSLVINQFSNFTICFLCVKNSEDRHLHWYVTILIYCDKKAFGQKYYVYDLDKTTNRYLDEFVLKHRKK